MATKMCKGTLSTGWVRNPVGGSLQVDEWSAKQGERQTGVKRIKMTCPVCKRRLWSSVSLCHDGCCVYHSLPRHKPYKDIFQKKIPLRPKKGRKSRG